MSVVPENLSDRLEELTEQIRTIYSSLKADEKKARMAELTEAMNSADFWNDQEAAQEVISELKALKVVVGPIDELRSEVEEATMLLEMAEDEDDQAVKAEIAETADKLEKQYQRVETQSLLSGKNDHRDAYLSIYAGDGGTEANDWAEMLMRMYLYYGESQAWEITEIDRHDGEEAGINDITLLVKGPYAYGMLLCERGTHRLARVSPFNAQGKRQTSFATVDVTPVIEAKDIQINEVDCDFEFFARASGPGGQNVNKVASACRVTHKPTGFTVVCSVERSQVQNKRLALGILQARLEQHEEEKREAEQAAETGGKIDTGWGTQIRSYVIYDNRVKDTRTGYEVGNPQRVLDGDLQGFIDAELRRRREQKAG